MRTLLPAWVAVALAGGAALLWVAELVIPLREVREPRAPRFARNLTLGALGFAVGIALQAAFLVAVAAWALEHEIGLLGRLPVESPFRLAAAFLLLDYTLWVWHRANHRVPFLWRFHRVHHVDRDMDASTGVRFHFGELALSAGYRALQIVVIGAEPLAVAVWQAVLLASVLFHHSNTRLPLALERVLVRLIVTPRMHGIHHSDRRAEADSNWASILSVWDWLHGTLRLDVPQSAVTIGVAAYQRPEDVTIGRILLLPWRGRPDDWARENGGPAERAPFGDTQSFRA